MKPRKAEGGAYEKRGRFFARVTVAPQKRTGVLLAWCTSLDVAEARGHALQRLVTDLRTAGQDTWIPQVLKVGGPADPAELASLERWVSVIVEGKGERTTTKGGPETFATFSEKWTDGTLHRDHPDHVRLKKSKKDDEYRLAIVCEIIGDVPLTRLTLDDAERVMRELDRVRAKRTGKPVDPLDTGSRRQYAQLLHRVLKLAAYPCRLIAASPLPGGWLPRSGAVKAKGVLYPNEEKQSIGSSAFPVEYRVFFGALARTGFRVDEAASLTMADVDVERGIVTLDENKTDDPRAPTFGPDVMQGLRAWKERYRAEAGPADPFFIRPDGARFRVDGLAELYRDHFLPAVGVTRRELFTRSATRIPIRVHDLRGAFVTYSLASGKTETWVMDRTGHRSSQMVNRYRRVARTVVEAGLGGLTPLHEAIPELAAAFTATNAAATGKKESDERDATTENVYAKGLIAQSVELRTFNP